MISWRRISRTRRILLLVLTILVLYVGSYMALSATGGWHYSQTGNLRYTFGLSVTDVVRWEPRWAYWEPFRDIYGHDTTRADSLGYFYSPLIRVDRAWVHPDGPIFPTSEPDTQGPVPGTTRTSPFQSRSGRSTPQEKPPSASIHVLPRPFCVISVRPLCLCASVVQFLHVRRVVVVHPDCGMPPCRPRLAIPAPCV